MCPWQSQKYFTFIDFHGIIKELGEPCEAAENQRENACRHGIQGAEVTDAALGGDVAYAIDNIVGGESCGLVEDENCVNHSSLWSSKAGRRSTMGCGSWLRDRGEMPYDVNSKIATAEIGAADEQ
jgi:hypothetical protein